VGFAQEIGVAPTVPDHSSLSIETISMFFAVKVARQKK
jgi:hypothetical protein